MSTLPPPVLGERNADVALKLLEIIAAAEGYSLNGTERDKSATKDWILHTFAECMLVIRRPADKVKPAG